MDNHLWEMQTIMISVNSHLWVWTSSY
jgi:hypothetical protein